MLTRIILSKVVDVVISATKKVLKTSGSRLTANRQDIEESITQHLRSIKNWSLALPIAGLTETKLTDDTFIPLNLFVSPRRTHHNSAQKNLQIPLTGIFDQDKHIILLGHPGAGKTTSMKYLALRLFLDENFHAPSLSFPLLIQLRNLNNRSETDDLIMSEIYNILGLSVRFSLPQHAGESDEDKAIRTKNEINRIKEKLIINVLEELKVLLIIDGFDELDPELRQHAFKEIATLATHLDECRMIVTSRTGEFIYTIDNTVQYEISPLSTNQTKTFVLQWFKGNEQKAIEFLNNVKRPNFDDAWLRPLNLAHLCTIYEATGEILDKPMLLYKRVLSFLIGKWDAQRFVKRYSKQENFGPQKKLDFFCRLAYELTLSLNKSSFNESDLRAIFKPIKNDFGLVGDDLDVINELEAHTGLIVRAGYDLYAFAHKSYQEYLTAEHLVNLSINTGNADLFKIPNEIASSVALSPTPSQYFADLLSQRLLVMRSTLTEEFVKSFLIRLLMDDPDLNDNHDLGLLLLAMYSSYIEANVLQIDRLNISRLDKVLSQFEKLIRSILSKETKHKINMYYMTEYKYETSDGDCIYRLTRIIEHTNPIRNFFVLPDHLYTRASFIN